MNGSYRVLLSSVAILVVLSAIVPAPSQETASESTESMIDRGKYLTHDVAKCVVCHSPLDQEMHPIIAEQFRGAVIPIKGPSDVVPWASQSASIVGLVNYSDGFVQHLLTTGMRPDGTRPRYPMPEFHLSEEDAKAVFLYLRSLKTN